MTLNPLEAWHHIVVTQDPSGLQTLLADDVVFHSPVVHTPQRGKEISLVQQRMTERLQAGIPDGREGRCRPPLRRRSGRWP